MLFLLWNELLLLIERICDEVIYGLVFGHVLHVASDDLFNELEVFILDSDLILLVKALVCAISLRANLSAHSSQVHLVIVDAKGGLASIRLVAIESSTK